MPGGLFGSGASNPGLWSVRYDKNSIRHLHTSIEGATYRELSREALCGARLPLMRWQNVEHTHLFPSAYDLGSSYAGRYLDASQMDLAEKQDLLKRLADAV